MGCQEKDAKRRLRVEKKKKSKKCSKGKTGKAGKNGNEKKKIEKLGLGPIYLDTQGPKAPIAFYCSGRSPRPN
jgi:hypothetical protein